VATAVAGARVDVRELETGNPVGIPISIRLSGKDIPNSARSRAHQGDSARHAGRRARPRRLGRRHVHRQAPGRPRCRRLHEGDHELAIISRPRPEERAQLSEIKNLYVNAQNSTQKVPLGQVSRSTYAFETEKIRRRNQFRTITVSAFPAGGFLPSQVLKAALPRLEELHRAMPGDYRFEIYGEAEEQTRSFQSIAVVFGLLLAAIFLRRGRRRRRARRDGRAAQLHGPARHESLFDAGLMRLRPVLITVVATVLGLVLLALHGGPLWQPLCYAQIGGLSFATFVSLLLVPMLYTIVIQDLKLIRWDKSAECDDAAIVAPSPV
jgi:Cu/Ag efflux pump CusA